MTKHWLFSDQDSGLIYGAYTALVYISPVLGGYLADKYLGQRKAVVFGAGFDLMVKDLGLAMEIAQLSDVNNSMGQLARELYGQHQESGNGQRDFSNILQQLQG